MWFANVHCFIRLTSKEQEDVLKTDFWAKRYEDAATKIPPVQKKIYALFSFTKYFVEIRIRVDNIEQLLGCFRLRWQRTGGGLGRLQSGNEYDIVSSDMIRGSFSLEPKNSMFIEIEKNSPGTEYHCRIFDDVAGK